MGEIRIVDKLQCAWGDRLLLAKLLLGYRNGFTMIPPVPYSMEPSIQVYATHVDIDPMKSVGGSDYYEKALVTITLGNLPYDVNNPREIGGRNVYVSEAIEPASEFLTLNGTDVYWADGDLVEDIEYPAKIIKRFNWIYKIHQLDYIPSQVWYLLGQINNNNVYSRILDKTILPGHLLFGNPSIDSTITAEGLPTHDITLRLTYQEENWNKFPKLNTAVGGSPDWQYLYKDDSAGDQVRIYASNNFSGIIVA